MRKLLMSLGCMFLMAGLVIAAETVTLKSYDKEKKAVTVTDKDGKDATYPIANDVKVTNVDKDGNKKEGKFENFEKLLSSEKAAGKAKFDITVEKGKITEFVTKGGGKKKDK